MGRVRDLVRRPTRRTKDSKRRALRPEQAHGRPSDAPVRDVARGDARRHARVGARARHRPRPLRTRGAHHRPFSGRRETDRDAQDGRRRESSFASSPGPEFGEKLSQLSRRLATSPAQWRAHPAQSRASPLNRLRIRPNRLRIRLIRAHAPRKRASAPLNHVRIRLNRQRAPRKRTSARLNHARIRLNHALSDSITRVSDPTTRVSGSILGVRRGNGHLRATMTRVSGSLVRANPHAYTRS